MEGLHALSSKEEVGKPVDSSHASYDSWLCLLNVPSLGGWEGRVLAAPPRLSCPSSGTHWRCRTAITSRDKT